MNRTLFYWISIFISNWGFSQFSVMINAREYNVKEAYLYDMKNGKDAVVSKTMKQNQGWTFKYPSSYSGMMKIYFPETNESVPIVSENKDIRVDLKIKDNKIEKIDYLDDVNVFMINMKDFQQKMDQVYPHIVEFQKLYDPNSDFGMALKKETQKLSLGMPIDKEKHPFVDYYYTNYKKYVEGGNSKNRIPKEEIANFLSNSSSFLETSLLIKPLLFSYLGGSTQESLDKDVDDLLKVVNIETSRGQNILSELIVIFDSYSLNSQKEKYLSQAKNLQCTINDRLSSTIKQNEKVAIGAKFPDSKFFKVTNTKAKSIYEVKAEKKIIFFWSSVCHHCEKELPEIIAKYSELKSKNIEVIALSMDSDKGSYEEKIKNLPWINDSDLKGWSSAFAELYNVHGTPSFFVLDSAHKILAKPVNFNDVISFLGLK